MSFRCVIIGIILITQIKPLLSQSGTPAKPNFFDEKLSLAKKSVFYAEDTALVNVQKQRIRVRNVSGDTLFFDFLDYEIGKQDTSSKFLSFNPDENYILYSDGMDRFLFTDWDISPLTIPIKIRPSFDDQPLQFIGDVSIGPYFGYQRGSKTYGPLNTYSELAFTIAAFACPGMIRMDPSTSGFNTMDSNTILGFTLGVGCLLNVGDYQLGLVTGKDWIGGSASQSWIYQGRIWYSFSFAYTL